jgi:NADH dehydrogenase [ubiquinone] 1 alpha subcomplex assembly factor 6
MEMVRESDRPRYLCTLWAPAVHRPALFALHAFGLELARIRTQVSEPMLGEIRLAWWREALDGVYACQPREHPVLQAMTILVDKGVHQSRLTALIDGRESEIFDSAMANTSEVEAFATQTAGVQNELVASLCGATSSEGLQAANDIGTAWGLLSLLRAVNFHARAQRHFLPHAELQAAGIDPDSLVSRPIGANIAPVVKEICERAEALLSRTKTNKTPKAAHFIEVWPRDFIARLTRNHFDISQTDFEVGDLRRQILLLRAAMIGIY